MALVSGREGRGPDGAGLAAVEVLGLDDLPDGRALAVSVEGAVLGGGQIVDLRPGQLADGDVSGAITNDRVLKKSFVIKMIELIRKFI